MKPREFLFWLDAFLSRYTPSDDSAENVHVLLSKRDLEKIRQTLKETITESNESERALKAKDEAKVLLLDAVDQMNSSAKEMKLTVNDATSLMKEGVSTVTSILSKTPSMFGQVLKSQLASKKKCDPVCDNCDCSEVDK